MNAIKSLRSSVHVRRLTMRDVACSVCPIPQQLGTTITTAPVVVARDAGFLPRGFAFYPVTSQSRVSVTRHVHHKSTVTVPHSHRNCLRCWISV